MNFFLSFLKQFITLAGANIQPFLFLTTLFDFIFEKISQS